MAVEPNYEEIKSAILAIVATYHVRAGEIVPLMGILMKLQPRFRASEIQDALNKMVSEELITHDGGRFIKLSKAGYALM